MNIERLRTDVSLWPDGATYCIDGYFKKWEQGQEFTLSEGMWVEEDLDSWSIDRYYNENIEFPMYWDIIERPTTEHQIIQDLLKALEFYANGKIFQRKADGQFTIAQEDGGQNAQEAIDRANELLEVDAGRVAHG